MERVRDKIVANSKTLQEEIRDITKHLDSLVDQNAMVVKEVQSMSLQDLSRRRNHFLKITEQQYAAIQKLLSINLELEEFVSTKTIQDAEIAKIEHILEQMPTKVGPAPVDSLSESSDNDKRSSDGGNKADSSDQASDPAKRQLTVNDKLKRMNLLSRRERFERSLPKVYMPDLSFKKKSSKSSSSGSSESKNSKAISAEESGAVVQAKKHQVLSDPPELSFGLLCFISYIKSPSEFYINYVDDNIQKLERMSQEAGELYNPFNPPFKSKVEARNNLGDFCFCYIEEWGIWCRVKVTNWYLTVPNDAGINVTVFLVDYGHTLSVSFTCLRELLDTHVGVPQYAIKCHFAFLHPPGSTPKNLLTDWPPSATQTFRNIVGIENESIFEVVYYEKEHSSSYAVDLTRYGYDDGELTIGQKLIDAGVAVEIITPICTTSEDGFIAKQIQTAKGMVGMDADMTEAELLDVYLKNIDSNEFANLDEAITGVRATDEARTCKLLVRNGVCNRKYCKFDHAPLRKDGYTTDVHEVFTEAFSSLVLPEIGSTGSIRITSIQKVNLWYGHLFEYVDGYTEFNKSLNATKNKLKRLQILPSRGELVVAKYDSEGGESAYFRAMVQDVCQTIDDPEPIVQLFLVDTGDTIDSKLSNLRMITKELLAAPFYAVACTLYKIKEKEGTDFDEILKVCESKYLNQWLDGKVMNICSSRLVVDFELYRGATVSAELVEMGLADELDGDLKPLSEHDLVD